MIRPAKIGDFPQVYDLLERLRDRIETYPGAELDRPSIMQSYAKCVNSQLNFAAVAEHDGLISGVLLGITQELWWSRMREATDLTLHAERGGDGLRMVRRFVEWAWKAPRVVAVTMAQSSGMGWQRSGMVLQRLGFEQIGGVWQIAKPGITLEVAHERAG